MYTGLNRVMKKITGLLFLLLSLVPLSIHAADLRVRVFERGGSTPLEGIAVCLGTHAQLDQFGAIRTGKKGYAFFENVPYAQLLVTSSMAGFKSEQESVLTSNTSRMLILSMSTGGGGPRCLVSNADTGVPTSGLAVSDFSVNRRARSTSRRMVKLNNTLTGLATHYRASERKDFSDTEWRYYATSPDFILSQGVGKKMVYLQVRRRATVNGATLELVSPVVSDSITLR